MRPRFGLKTMLIVVAALAPVCWAGAWLWRGAGAMDERYGKGGLLDRQQSYSAAMQAGGTAAAKGRFAEGERSFRLAMSELEKPFYYLRASPRDVGLRSPVMLGLAETLAGRGRIDEAEALFAEAINLGREELGEGHPYIEEMWVHRAESLSRGMQAARLSRATSAETHRSP